MLIKNNCEIYNKYFIDDLIDNTLVDSANGLYIEYGKSSESVQRYSNSPNSIPIRLNESALFDLISSNLSNIDNINKYDNIWIPIFIDETQSQAYVKQKQLLRGGSVESVRLGIENFLSFAPAFKSWSIDYGSFSMNSDWIINSDLVPFDPKYGLMFWIKFDSSASALFNSNAGFFDLIDFPIGSRLISSNKTYYEYSFIKLDNDTLEFAENPNTLIKTSDLGENVKFCLFKPNCENFYSLFNKSVRLWISDGEFFNYFLNDNDQYKSYSKNIPSRSYLSPCLFTTYNNIYNQFTISRIKSPMGRSLREIRLLKKLSYLLATGPLMQSVNHNYLSDSLILESVSLYLQANPRNIYDEINLLKRVSFDIYNRLKTICIGLNNSTVSGNLISSRNELYKKIISKYRPSLTLQGQANIGRLRFNNALPYGDSIYFNQIIESYCDKNLPADTLVYNNFAIATNNCFVGTSIGQNNNIQYSEIRLGQNTVLPLTECIKEPIKNDEFTIGKDQIVYREKLGETSFAIEGMTEISYDRRVGYVWELEEGSCARFSDYNKDKSRQVRFFYSTETTPTVYVYDSGKFTIKCTVKTDNSSAIDIKTVYVVEKNSSGQWVYKDGNNYYQAPKIPEKSKVKLKSGELKVICPNITDLAIHKRGIFWPIKTDLFIGKYGSVYDDQFIRLQGNERFVFEIDKRAISHSNSTLQLQFSPHNTTIKIQKVNLQNIRNEYDTCSQCLSFYKDLLVADPPTYSRRLRSPDNITLPRYNFNKLTGEKIKIGDIDFHYPEISTDDAPKIYGYGGYPLEIINSLGVKPPNHSDIMPVITGHKLDYDNKLCFQKEPNYLGKAIEFSKGSLHPASGWIMESNSIHYQNTKNKSSVLKFNPGARKSFTFTGAGFDNLVANYDTLGYVIPNIFTSAISVSIDPRIVPDKQPDTDDQNVYKAWLDAQQRKELRDHDVNHGYRYLNDGIVADSDEFGYDSSVFDKTNPNCGGTTTSYLFSSLGPKKIQEKQPKLGELNLQDLIVPDMKIDSLEVRLNFLNYVNPKDLIIWLDVDVCDFEANKMNGGEDGKTPRCQIGSAGGDNISPDSVCISPSIIDKAIAFNSELSNYSKELVINNSSENRTKLRLYLLYQDHIENNCYNFSLAFSDDASADKTLNYDNLDDIIKFKQKVALLGETVKPTTSTLGYSDLDKAKYRYLIDNLKRFTNTSFQKFKNLYLFKDAKGERSSSSTTFTLNIAVVDEPDSMRVYDNTESNNILTRVSSIENKQSSDSLYNSLCNWELVLHTSSSKEASAKDCLGLLEYGKDPRFPGYSFIADFSDKHFLLPTVNHNAPLTHLLSKSLCRFPNFETMQSLLVKMPEFPEKAILAAQASFMSSLFGMLSGSASSIVGIAESNPTYAILIQWFTDVRRSQEIDQIIRNLDRAKYDNYPFGSSEKILLNVSKDNLIWYKLEAGIFRYFNTILLNSNKYAYVKLNKDQLPILSTFKLNFVDTSDALVDNVFLSKFVDRIVSVKDPIDQMENNSIVKTSDNKFFLVKNNSLISFPEAYIYSNKLSNYYFFGSMAKNIFSDIDNKIKNRRLIITEDRLAYDLFDLDEKIRCFVSSDKKIYRDILVVNKALIIKNNIYYSVIELAENPFDKGIYYDGFSFVSPVIAVFKNYQTNVENLPIDKWGLEKSRLGASVPINDHSTIGVGSYGDGSPFVYKEFLTYNLQANQLQTIDQLFPARNIKNTNIVISDLRGNLNHINTNIINNYYSFNRNKQIVSNNVLTDDPIFSDKIRSNILCSQEENLSFCITKLSYDIPNYGYISFENDFIQNVPVSYLSQAEIDVILDRVRLLESPSLLGAYIGQADQTDYIVANGSIEDISKHYDALPTDSAFCFDKNINDKSNCLKRKMKQSLYNVYNERNNLLKILEQQSYNFNGKIVARYNNPEVLPFYSSFLTKNLDNSLSVEYKPNKDYYWINIDPKQGCSVAEDVSLKILTKIEYTCEPVVGTILDSNADQICPQDAKSSIPLDIDKVDMFFTKSGNTFTYSVGPAKIAEEKQKYANYIKDWKEITFTKTFFINSGGPRDTLVKSVEYYDLAIDPNEEKNDYSNISNRVYSTFNLDNTSTLFVKFRNIPRKLKGVDNHYAKQVPNKDGDLVDVVNPAAGGPVYNNLTFWNCISADQFKYVDPTDYLKVQNEMIYRAFFNSADGIEHKAAMLESLYPWEWIPYEYYIR